MPCYQFHKRFLCWFPVSQAELEKRVRDLSSSLSAAQRRLQRAEARTVETPALLVRLQHKLALLEQSHAVAIREVRYLCGNIPGKCPGHVVEE